MGSGAKNAGSYVGMLSPYLPNEVILLSMCDG